MGAAMLLSSVPASAQMTHYTDVESGAWFEASASALLESGALDRSETRLRPNDLATRAEAMKLLVNVYGEDLVYPATSTFADVSKTAWYFPYVEAAARAGWIKGDRNCYETGARPCYARPAEQVNRAEMATILQRAYSLQHREIAPVFSDNPRSEWYFLPIQTAADHCILQGDSGTDRVRPAASMNRAEMVVMFDRASRGLQYGRDCGDMEETGNIVSVTALSSRRVRVSFNVDLDANRIDDTDRYMLERVGGGDVEITGLTVVGPRVVELDLETSLVADTNYRLSVEDMMTGMSARFSDSQNFTSLEAADAEISTITVVDADSLTVRFDTDLDAQRADDASRYSVERSAGGGEIDVVSAVIVDDRTVNLTLASGMAINTSYKLITQDLMTDAGVEFDFTKTYTSQATAPNLESATAVSSTRIRLDFNTDLDEERAEEVVRYLVNGFRSDLDIDDATLTDSNTVEIDLDDAMIVQEQYQIRVTNLLTSGGATFSDDINVVFGSGSSQNVSLRATLNGTQEVPAVISPATGTGTFTLTATGLQYDITVRGISGSLITGAHFHRGDVGAEGAVIEPITFSGLRATGTWSDLTNEERILLLDGDVYVNIHTNANPDGEIRGQIVR